jgi:TrmH family RNA methyltransferase
MITSVQKEKVQHVRSLARRRVRQREGRFVVEGTRLLDELVGAGIEPALVFYTEAWAESPAGLRVLPQIRVDGGAWPVTGAVMAACADTQTPQGVLAVVPFMHLNPRPGLFLILDAVRDPGNLGTILRSGEAAGVGQVLLAPGTVDLYNPKVVRGAMGAHFRLPVFSHDAVDWTQPSALIVGGEASGAGQEAAQIATGRVSIPMTGGAESLNAAMAATVILFEAARQRRISALKETP